MKKRLLSALVCAALVVTLAPAALAAREDVPQSEKALVLDELEILSGDETGNLHLDRNLTRAEMTKLTIAASPLRESVGDGSAVSPYPDVPYTHWAAPWVKAAVDGGYVKGNLQGYFEPNRAVTLAEGVTMTLRLLGYGDSDFTSVWPTGQMALYRSLQLDAGMTATAGDAWLTRADALHLLYNLLTVKTKTGAPYITALGHTLNADGEVDVEALLKLEREGPIPVTGRWQEGLPYDVAEATVYRDGKRAALGDLREWDTLYWAKEAPVLWAFPDSGNMMTQLSASVAGPVVAVGDWRAAVPYPLGQSAVTRNGRTATASDIAENDVVYWNKHANQLYIYTEKVTGLVEGIAPSLAAPTSVTVAGKAYPLESSAAIYAFSDLGTFRKGDTVTLLLGRTNGVAAVIPPLTEPSAVLGFVTAVGSKNYTDAKNQTFSAPTITLTATDGTTGVYRWDKDNVKVGDLARVTVTTGGTTVEKLPALPLTGRVNPQGDAVGKVPLATDVEILDTYGDTSAGRVWPSRLAGVTLTGKMVRYYEENPQGEIAYLILNDVTGDLHRYGVLTEVSELSMGMTLQGSYRYDVGGTPGLYTSNGKLFSVKTGPAKLWMEGGTVSSVTNLTELKNSSVAGSVVTAGGKKYTLAPQAPVYLKKGDEYTLTTLDRVTGEGYTLSAYCDRPEVEGGQVRVLVALAQ